MFLKLICFCFFLFGLLTDASVTVCKTSQGPTGYEVTWRYENPTASSVTIAGGIQPFTDQYHANPDGSARYDPRNYKPGWFLANGSPSLPSSLPYQMTNQGNGSWIYTTPLPSGTYNYAFVVDCPANSTCGIDSGHYVIDPDVPPFMNVQGDQIQSTFQVPFDSKFQYYADIDLNFDYTLPVDKAHQGTVQNVNYTSPGSVHPAQDVHDFVIYLPTGYTDSTSKKYPLLYLSHGGGGDGQDWQNIGQASNILDRLILEKHIDPTVVVMPSFYNIAPQYKQVYGSNIPMAVSPSAPVVRENYMAYLFPFVERTFAVSTDPSHRAFAGLSLGSILTYEMYINATSYFSYFGLFSGVLGPAASPASYLNASTLAANPALREKGLFTSAGLYDIAFSDVRNLQRALQTNGVPFLGRIVPYGYHAWNTWQDCLWHFGVTTLWRERPFQANPITPPLFPPASGNMTG